ncbi:MULTISPECIES: DUF6873 family GME fold protein [Thermoanaerobacterium]|uniref:DUF6873 domain-containing protein n=2 Tax=Thermoanaerobacterium TaxID=28895 RepID=W9EEA7_9THEO|nr:MULTISPECIES: hypothetical protein [Thermoanaerobacterium]AFK87210.1 hypothetical protein Tsac_2206 [Thermoanaerobacterium saccharolyticum JW/SL-YS485]ETO38094.1 hypothetical protein V518_1743 [Thermoanaerobacterium aotearoense SCUT27]
MSLKNPYVPDKKVSHVIIDGRHYDVAESLRKMEIDVIMTKRHGSLYEAISYHPDMIVHNAGDGQIVLAPDVDENFVEEIKKLNLEVIFGKTVLSRNYPDNIAYNVARLGDYAFHNLKYTDPVLRKVLEKKGVKFIHVNQGYTKCNMAIVDNASFITSDAGVYKTASKEGFDCLLIEQGGIKLNGFDYGFIGGASGLIDKDVFCIAGDLRYHGEYKKIIDFMKYKNKEIIFLTSGEVKDIGSIIPLY